MPVIINEIDIYQKTGPNLEDKELFYPKTTWSQVIEKPSWIGENKPSYSWSDISDKPGVVVYDSAQSLTTAQQQQARANIGAGTPYTLPIATATVLGGVKSSTTGTSGTDYAVQVNSDGTMKVNVPTPDLSDYVTLNTEQTISAKKTFSSPIKIKAEQFGTSDWFLNIYSNFIERADSTTVGAGTHRYTYKFPDKIGTFALLEDLTWGNIKDTPNFILSSQIGVAGGVASLGTDGKVPSSQLPAYVDDVLEYASREDFPEKGESDKIYVAQDTNLTYRWGGTEYVEVSPSIGLGETSSTAYPGNKGKANADAIAALQKVGNVRYDTMQSLTTAQQQQARANIGAGTPYTLPIATATVLGGVKSSTTGTSGTDYAVQVNSDGTMKVNVPTPDLSDYVTLDTEQTISADKFFSKGTTGPAYTTVRIKTYDGSSPTSSYGVEVDQHGDITTYQGSCITHKPYGSLSGYSYSFPNDTGTIALTKNISWETLGSTASGDLTGNYPNPTIKAGAVDDTKLSKTGVKADTYSAVQVNEQGRVEKGAYIFMAGTSATIPSELAIGGLYFHITNTRTVA